MNPKILLVDDDLNILSAYKRNLRAHYDVSVAESGEIGLKILEESGPFVVTISDYNMPLMNGIEFLKNVKMYQPDTIRIMLTGQADLESAINAVNEGNIFRFLTKPCPHDSLISTLEAAVEQYNLVTSERVLLEKTLKGSIKVLVDLLTILNPTAFSLASRLKNWARKVAIRMELPKIWEIDVAALLSQIGCVTIPPEILNKAIKGEKLNEKESKIYLKHPSFGKHLISNIPRLDSISDGILYQLKNYDGSGFPEDQKKGEDIPYIGRILRVILEYDNITQGNVKPKEALEIIRKNIKFFDPDIFKAFEAEVLLVEQGYIIQNSSLNDVISGMIIAEDIKNLAGNILVTKGTEMTDALKARLTNYAHMSGIMEPIKVLELLKR